MLLIVGWTVSHVWLWRSSSDTLEALHENVALISVYTRQAFEGFVESPNRSDFSDGILPLVYYGGFHSGLISLLFNVVFLWVFGGRLESRAGSTRYATFLILTALAGGVAQLWGEDREFLRHTVGGSAIVAGCIVAYLVYYLRSRITLVVPLLVVPVTASVPAIVLPFAWIVVQFEPIQRFIALGDSQPLSYAAVGGGAAAGLAGSILLFSRRRAKDRKKPANKKPAKKPG